MSIRYFCLQPIKLADPTFFNIHLKKYIPNPKKWFDITQAGDLTGLENCNIPKDWLSELCAIEDHKIYTHQSNYFEFDVELTQLKEVVEHNADLNVDKKNSGYILCYDVEYNVFFLVICLSLNLNDKTHADSLIGLHMTIRDQLVIDNANGNAHISQWASAIHKSALSKLSLELNVNSTDEQISIKENSGYLCSFYPEFTNKLVKNSLTQYKNDFLHKNHPIDLIDEKKFQYSNMSLNKTIAVNNESAISPDNNSNNSSNNNFDTHPSIIFFGWRSSTLYGIKENRDLKILPLLINIQNIYFQIDTFYKPYLSDLYEEIRYNNDYVTLSEKLEFYDKLVVSFQSLRFEKDIFIAGIKPFQTEIYYSIEDYWGLTKAYDNIEKTLNICQTSLERKLSIKNNKIQQKQSDILFVLAIIQIFSILSIIGDYFSLYSMKVSPSFENEHNNIKQYLIYSLAFLSIALITFAYIEKVWYSLKKTFRRITNRS